MCVAALLILQVPVWCQAANKVIPRPAGWVDQLYENPLVIAIQKGSIEEVDRILSDQATRTQLVNKALIKEGVTRDTPLSLAVRGGNHTLITKLINAKADVNFIDPQGTSLLMWTLDNNQGDTARLLIQAGAGVNVINQKKQTALMVAIMKKMDALAQLILAQPGVNLNAQDAHGNTALMLAAMHNKALLESMLASNMPDLNIKNDTGQTAIMQAAKAGNWDSVLLLTRAGANLDTQDKDGATLLMTAYKANKPDVVEELIKKGANISLLDKDGNTLVTMAVKQMDAKMLQLLHQYGANLAIPFVDGQSILHLFIAQDKFDQVPLLLATKIPLDMQDKQGMTPLMLAVAKGHQPTVKALIEKGANTLIKNQAGKTAFDLVQPNPSMLAVLQPSAVSSTPLPSGAATQQPAAVQPQAPSVEQQPIAESARREGPPAVVIPPTPAADATAAAYTPPPVFQPPVPEKNEAPGSQVEVEAKKEEAAKEQGL